MADHPDRVTGPEPEPEDRSDPPEKPAFLPARVPPEMDKPATLQQPPLSGESHQLAAAVPWEQLVSPDRVSQFQRIDAGSLVASWLGSLKKPTVKSYKADLGSLALFLGAPNAEAAATAVVGMGPDLAMRALHAWREEMTAQELSSGTIARRLSSIKSMLRVARRLGVIRWTIELEPPRVQPYRDTAGPPMEAFRQMLEATLGLATPWRERDHAILRLLFDLALRRAEVSTLDVRHVEFGADPPRVMVLGKKRTGREPLTLPMATQRAIRAWLRVREPEAREEEPGLFVGLQGPAKGKRLAPWGVWSLVKKHGAAVGVDTWTHGIRHLAITRALDQNNGDVRKVQKYSRHVRLDTVAKYDDNRRDIAGEVAEQLSEDLPDLLPPDEV